MQLNDPQKFTIVSAVIVICVIVAIDYTASTFYRQAMIERELYSMRELVLTVTSEEEEEKHLSLWDLRNYTESSAFEHLEHTFGTLAKLAGFTQVKVFNSGQEIAWSNTAELIGTKRTQHPEAVARALADDAPLAFNPARVNKSLIEYYIPFKLGGESSSVAGVVAVYRSSDLIDAAIQRGVYLLWLVTGLGGFILYVALYRLFVAVYRDRNIIGSKFEKFTADNKRLIQIERLSAMGQMVTEIAHQLNNPLVGVVNLTELAELEVDNPSRVKELLGQVRAAGELCREYVQRMLGLSQLTHSEKKPTDLAKLVNETVVFFRQSLGGRPEVTFEMPAESVTCNVDPILIRNAFFNLIHNAAQADPNGPIVISLTREQRDGKFGYCFEVLDRGPGFPPGVADKLFTPFFTTRPEGTGLGLSIAQQIAILHEGSISAENRPDGGTRFTIWIPAG